MRGRKNGIDSIAIHVRSTTDGAKHKAGMEGNYNHAIEEQMMKMMQTITP